MIIWGDTYRDRETLIGTIPDVLTCIDGGEGTIRECQTALRLGSSILLLALKDTPVPGSLPTIYQDNAEMTAAINDGTMVVCRSAEAIAESADQAIQATARGKRQQRLNLLAEHLG